MVEKLESGPFNLSLKNYVIITRVVCMVLKFSLAIALTVHGFLVCSTLRHQEYDTVSTNLRLLIVTVDFTAIFWMIPNMVTIMAVKKNNEILLNLALMEAGISCMTYGAVVTLAVGFTIMFLSSMLGYFGIFFVITLPILLFVWQLYDFTAIYSLKYKSKTIESPSASHEAYEVAAIL